MKHTLAFLSVAFALMAFALPSPSPSPEIPADVQALLDKHGCAACHSLSRKLVGPMWPDIAAKKYTAKRIMELVRKPEPAHWPGSVPMLAQTNVPKADLTKIANWLAKL